MKTIPQIKIEAKTTSLSHAIRWINEGHQFLSPEDARAIRDEPIITLENSGSAMFPLLLALRHGQIRAKGILSIIEKESPRFREDSFDPNIHWDNEIKEHLKPEHLERRNFLHEWEDEPINPILWIWDCVDWGNLALKYPGNGEYQANFINIELQTDGLLKVFPLEHPEPTQKNKSGRSAKYDWDSFYVEIAVIADLDALPEMQAELEKKMAEWCLENWGTEPSETSIRNKISPIYNHHRKIKK